MFVNIHISHRQEQSAGVDAFLFFRIPAVDNSIPNRLGFRFTANRGRLLENAVFLELKRRGCEVYYFSGKNECDFLIRDNLRVTEAMQVVYELNAENIQREIDGLTEAMHTFDIPKGTLIVFDAHPYQIELPQGVSVISAGEWMLISPAG